MTAENELAPSQVEYPIFSVKEGRKQSPSFLKHANDKSRNVTEYNPETWASRGGKKEE